jgi:hypothetical protein
MDMEGSLRDRIVDASTSAGSRVYWVDRPQLAGLPAVTLQVVSDPQPQHLKGFEGTRRTLVQVDCWADTYAVAKALKEAVVAAVVPEATNEGIRFDRAIVDNNRTTGDRAGDKFVHQHSIDLGVWWATT